MGRAYLEIINLISLDQTQLAELEIDKFGRLHEVMKDAFVALKATFPPRSESLFVIFFNLYLAW